MIEAKKYTKGFFSELETNSYNSAKEILLLLYQIIQPKSVIDVGCGTGLWLKVWDEVIGVNDYLGIEGPYVKPEMLRVPINKVLFKDLKDPIALDRKYDIATSLEVAEHLPESSASQFISTLTSLSDIILFSAAIPYQEGTYHINEQYPEYWAKHFKELGFIPVDYLRPLIWNNPNIQYWYRQNILLFVNSKIIGNYPELVDLASSTNPEFLTRIHPYLYELKGKYMKDTETFFGFLNRKWFVLKTKLKGKK
jgi:hypothetical protein